MRPFRAFAKHTRASGMNRLEAKYAALLAEQKLAGLIAEYQFEAMRLKIGSAQKGVDAWFTPDFLVISADGQVEFHETKGFMQEAANVRIKAAAAQYPGFVFKLIRWKDKAWIVETI